MRPDFTGASVHIQDLEKQHLAPVARRYDSERGQRVTDSHSPPPFLVFPSGRLPFCQICTFESFIRDSWWTPRPGSPGATGPCSPLLGLNLSLNLHSRCLGAAASFKHNPPQSVWGKHGASIPRWWKLAAYETQRILATERVVRSRRFVRFNYVNSGGDRGKL